MNIKDLNAMKATCLLAFGGVLFNSDQCLVIKGQPVRPFPSWCEPHYESEAKCQAFLIKMCFFACEWRLIFITKALRLTSLS